MLKLKRLPEYLGCTPGTIYLNDRFLCHSIELPWRDNLPNISCIPKGTYTLAWTWSPRFKRMTVEIMSVPDRQGIRFHDGNEVADTEGCPLTVLELHIQTTGVWGRNSDMALERLDRSVRDSPYTSDLIVL